MSLRMIGVCRKGRPTTTFIVITGWPLRVTVRS